MWYAEFKKNIYRWNGKEGLPRWFAELQRSGLEEEAAKALDVSSSIGNGEKVKGMTQTAQRLIQIFLVTGRREIAITDAAEELMPLTPAEQSDRQKAMKQKCRRLYDIANVLQSIGVIQKENAGSEARSFRWVYPITPQDMHNYLGTLNMCLLLLPCLVMLLNVLSCHHNPSLHCVLNYLRCKFGHWTSRWRRS